MYHQKIPSYDGAQPFIYAAYCKEDEALAYPVLARMYNEGFRVCCAPSTGVASDYYKQQRLQSAASVIMFMSRHMAERLRSGDPDVLAAARNPLLRTVILLDSTDVSNNIFAMAVPDHQEYIRENDSAFWLYIYSNDYFDGCRGKWPEKQLLLRDPVYEDISEEVVNEEYLRLQSIMTGHSSESRSYDPFDADTLYENNPGYIPPQPDEFVYEPLERISVVRTEQDDQYDEVLDLINQVENSVEESRKRSAEAAAAAAETVQNTASELAKREIELEKAIAEAPVREVIIVTTEKLELVEGPELAPAVKAEEHQAEPKAEPKADIVVTPAEPAEKAEADKAEKDAEAEPVPLIPATRQELEAAVSAIIASAGVLLKNDNEAEAPAEEKAVAMAENNDASALQAAEPAADAKTAENAEDAAANAPAEVIPAEVPAEAVHESKAESAAPAAEERRHGRVRRGNVPVSVPVMVRRQQAPQRSRVEVKMRRSMHVSSTPSSANRSAMHFSSMPADEGGAPHSISDSITFEQYVRDIARSYVSELLEQPEEQNVPAAAVSSPSPSRKHRQRSAVVQESEVQPQYSIELVAPAEGETEAEEPKSARKSRHPHQKNSFFTSIINALRSERHRREEELAADSADAAEDTGSAEENDSAALQMTADAAETAEISAASEADNGAVSDENASAGSDVGTDLQSVVEKFVECNRVPSITVVPRTMVRRYRD